ncbi:hypothetical protein [Streptomyces spiramenti]|uniref:Lipoprotein n=1 Tax=Streptomyces spiramenti TaxID=2720606 RepID=A0ABX1AJD9_9ACTN|nr:hypothetical protein [Streptomyces spiramenti]NJP65766.1 hypothetical protein [Streptomyces spiramenti]
MIAAVLATGLLATACGGSDDSTDDALPGVDTTSSASPEPTDEESEEGEDGSGEDELPDDGIDRPEITLPDDVNNVFEKVDTDDPVELAVLADQEHGINAVDEAITSGDTKVPSLPFYQADMALLESVEVIASMHDDKLSFGGTTRYYNRSLEMQSETAAVSSYCRDTSESYLIDLETGEQEPDGGTTHFTSRQQVNDAGVWQTVTLEARDGEGRCEQ